MINVCYLIVEIKEDKPMFSFCSFLLLTKKHHNCDTVIQKKYTCQSVCLVCPDRPDRPDRPPRSRPHARPPARSPRPRWRPRPPAAASAVRGFHICGRVLATAHQKRKQHNPSLCSLLNNRFLNLSFKIIPKLFFSFEC